ncbi:MAG: acyl-CoA dehydrogenase [Coxiellaceae bacterium]|nr:acyl-CoA dehydrogenase [Coxiellaceae bacterium]
MELLLSWLVVLIVLTVCLYCQARSAVTALSLFSALIALAYINSISLLGTTLLFCTGFLVYVFFVFAPLRRNVTTRFFMPWFKRQQSEITPVEQAVLDAGGHWIERELLSGSLSWDKLFKLPVTPLTDHEQHFLDHQVEHLCSLLDDWKICHEDKDLSSEAWDYIKQERFFGIEIDTALGGLGFSPAAHSAIITKIATCSISAAYTVMVPNSLGPAELIHHFGSQEQKQHYLPRLSSGQEIPCFALTGPEAGSDAASLPDRGVICSEEYQGKQVIGVRLNWEKRYITLAPIATLIGLAVHVYDPDNLIGDDQDLGIQVVLVPHDTPGVSQGARHMPMSLGFMNGTLLGNDVFLPLTQVLGTLSSPNQGWMMLLECLSIGRGISMPALSSAVGQQCFKMTSAYCKVREQFNRPIGEFEGVKTALSEIGGLTYLIAATRYVTTEAVVQGAKPSVASVMSKYHLTELSRKILARSMDIHAGHGLQMGPRNLLANVFNGQPISTVGEGANIMTRNLIIFGQGVMRSHPFLKAATQAAYHENQKYALKQFDRHLWCHVKFLSCHFIRGIFSGLTGGSWCNTPSGIDKTIRGYCQKVIRMNHVFIIFTDLTLAILGKQLKVRESISARLGDVFSYLYLLICLLKFYNDEKDKHALPLLSWACDYALSSAYEALEELANNFPKPRLARCLMRLFFPWGRPFYPPKDDLSHQLADWMQESTPLRDRLTQLCYVGDTMMDPVYRLENAFQNILQNHKLFDKVNQGIKEGTIFRGLTRHDTLRHALSKAIINQAEYDLLMACEELRDQACAVDVFDAFNKGFPFSMTVEKTVI